MARLRRVSVTKEVGLIRDAMHFVDDVIELESTLF
jgi:hypothetical protein